ncbi:hypothetical protein HCN44_005060 [Aphidius gifuensis]|uniref:Enoyl-CoA hydratase n=1 Tax=Aphidius gifuensis TaxID=684658 RepID=A0A834XXP7_APHGI|nr:probable enoyl-CoA hydratase [Aphidius gifuensis]KAF7992716.1 hypothetical protein HCN44_005060 [Aphidius gifuensis]
MLSTSRLALSLRRLLQNQFYRGLTSEAQPHIESPVQSDKEKSIVITKSGPITLFGINRTSKKNCLDSIAVEELSDALNTFDENDETGIGIIHGIGGTFCSGFDLDEIAKSNGNFDNLPHFSSLFSKSVLTKKPLIASISGYAVGMGFELALMCDIRIVEESSRLGFLNKRFGIPIMCGGTVRLPAMVGYSRAMDLILSGRELTSEDAVNWGIATRAVACGAALGQCITLAHSIVKYPRAASDADRASLNYAVFGSKPIEDLLEFEKTNATDGLLDEGIKGAQRFVDGFGRHGKASNMNTTNVRKFKQLEDDVL